MEWEMPMAGVRHKYLDQENIRTRLVEYTRDMPPHWCEKPHYGIVLEGVLELEFDHATLTYNRGDALFLPADRAHRHRARAVSETVRVFFVETPLG